jgi:hypothetical protein
MSREQDFHIFNITEADVDAVIDAARAAGEDVQELEEAKAGLYGPGQGEVGAAQALGWKLRLLIALLRHGGEGLAKLLARLGPKAAGFVRRYAKALADFLETGEKWVKGPIILFLQSKGVPYAEAAAIAELIVLFLA